MGKTQTNNVREEAIRLLEDDCYRFDNLSSVLGISEKEAKILKTHIMKEFWLGNLEHVLVSFHGQQNKFIDWTNISQLENQTTLTRESFHCQLLPPHINKVDEIKPNVNENFEYVDQDKKTIATCSTKTGDFMKA